METREEMGKKKKFTVKQEAKDKKSEYQFIIYLKIYLPSQCTSNIYLDNLFIGSHTFQNWQ